jgi:predicted Ser/Thr protein kinase
VDVGDGPMIVKDFGGKSFWWRLLGRIQIAREYRAYRWLAGAEGIPALIGRVDAYALAFESIRGEQLAFARDRHERAGVYLARLRRVLDGLHERGLVHQDLRGRENVLVGEGGEVVVVDLASAVRFRPGSLAYRLFFPLLARTDEAAYLKWKAMLSPGSLSEQERRFLARHRRWRRLWPFNRKGAGRPGNGT